METRNAGVNDTISFLYIALFGRAPDAKGFEHWTTVLESLMLFTGDEGLSIARVVEGMGESPEYETIYQDLTPEEQVNRLYQNLFSRDADPDGLAFWSGKIVTGQIPFTDVAYLVGALAFGGGTGINPDDTALLRNKVDVSKYLAGELGTNDGQVIQNAFNDVTTDPASVGTARASLFRQLNPVEEPEVVETPVDDSPAPDPVVTPTPQNVSLTNGVDTLSGNSDGAVVSGFMMEPAGTSDTFEIGDSISNFSKIEIEVRANPAPPNQPLPVVQATLSNIGQIEFDFSNAGGVATVNASQWTDVRQSWILDNNTNQTGLTISDGLLTTVYGVKDSSKETMYNIRIRSDLVSGTTDTLQVALSNAGSPTDETYINSESAVETLTVDTEGTNHVILNDFSSQDPTQGSIGTVTVTGGGINSFDVGADSSNVLRMPALATLDFSQATGNNTLSVGNVVTNNLSITGGQGNDIISGGAGADIINAGAGNNVITDAGVGADVITHDAASSTVAITVSDSDLVLLTALEVGATVTIGGTDLTTNRDVNASLSNASVTINGAALTTGRGVYVGGFASDTITGGGGDDVLFGRAGADSLTGGAGNDIFVFNPGDSTSAEKDSITDFGNGADVIGIVDNSGNLTGIDLTSHLSGVSGIADTATSTLTVVQGGSTNTVVSIKNGSGAQLTIDKSNVALDVTLADGADRTAVGGDLNDIIRGGNGNDSITGGDGADELTGGDGADELTGGAGSDTFVIGTNSHTKGVAYNGLNSNWSNVDAITDFDGAGQSSGDSINLGLGADAFGAGITFTTSSTANLTAVTIAGGSVNNINDIFAQIQSTISGGGVASSSSTAQIYDVTLTTAYAGVDRLLIINNNVDGIANVDAVINMTGITGALDAQDFTFLV